MTKRSALAGVLALALSFTAGAQSIDNLSSAMDQLVKDLNPALPTMAETGLVWSDAYIGGFPNFGAGVSVGSAFIPKSTLEGVTKSFGIALPDSIKNTPDFLGVPLPAYTLEARLGLPVLPMDVGAKFGTIPNGALTGDLTSDYTLIGADVRYKLLDNLVVIPAISVGAGVSYMQGSLSYKMADIPLFTYNTGPSSTANVTITNPKATIFWKSTVINARAQASWNLLIITPYVGVDAAYSNSEIGARFTGTLSQDLSAYSQYNSGYSLGSDKIERTGKSEGAIAYKFFGGASLNLMIFRLDLNAGYNPAGKSINAGVNARIQL